MTDFELLSIIFMVMSMVITVLVEWIKQNQEKK